MSKFEDLTRQKVALALLKYQQREHISQKQLADRLHISVAQLRRYVNKNANMSVSVLCRICELTGLHTTLFNNNDDE